MKSTPLLHYQNQSSMADLPLLRDHAITFSVLISILQKPCADIYTNRKSIIICHSEPPFPVWVWCENIHIDTDIACIAECLKQAFPLEQGYSYNLSCELLTRLQEKDPYFHCADIKLRLLSYRLNKLQTPRKPCDGFMALAQQKDLEQLAALWHAMVLETQGHDHNAVYCNNQVRTYLDKGSLFTWLHPDGQIVALTAKSDCAPYSKISAVYTLPEHRRKGYAIHLVSQVTETILADHLIPILYTDADYEASNACYRKLGFGEIGRLCTVYKKSHE